MKIVIADYPDSMMPTHELEKKILISGLGSDTNIVIFEYSDNKREEFFRVIRDADAILTAFTKIDSEVMDHAPKLKVISINATGYDNVDLEEANKRKIGVCPVGEYCTEDVAEFTITTSLAMVKNLKSYIYDIDKNKQWRYDYVNPNPRIADLTIGICGFGKIGTRVAQKAKALGMKVIATDPFTNNKLEDVELVTKEELVANADIITNNMNLNETNHSYFNYDAFKLMEKKPYLINMGRGACMVERDLLQALDEKLLKGAALDVLSDETPDLEKNQLVGRSNVLITPHVAFYSTSSLEDLQRISTENIVNYLTGQKQKVFKLVTDL